MKTKADLRRRWYRARGHAGSSERLEGFGQLATIYTRTKCQMLGRGVECHGAARWWTRPRQNQPSAVPGSCQLEAAINLYRHMQNRNISAIIALLYSNSRNDATPFFDVELRPSMHKFQDDLEESGSTATIVTEKNSDKFSWDLDIWCHRLGHFFALSDPSSQ